MGQKKTSQSYLLDRPAWQPAHTRLPATGTKETVASCHDTQVALDALTALIRSSSYIQGGRENGKKMKACSLLLKAGCGCTSVCYSI